MLCTKCKGKLKTIQTVRDTETNEVMRYKRCRECNHEMYTCEFEIEEEEYENRT